MTETPPAAPPADWYTDPQSPGQQRWWSGTGWTEHVRPLPQPMPSAPTPVVPSTRPAKVRRGFLDSPFEPVGTPRNVPGTLALVFALLPFAVSWLIPGFGPLLALASGVTAVVLGIVGVVRAGRVGARRGTAIAGLVIGALSTVGALVIVIATISASASKVNVPLLESEVVLGVLDQTGEVVTVDCPTSPPADAGSTFTCVARGEDGVNFRIDVTIQDDEGSAIWQIAG